MLTDSVRLCERILGAGIQSEESGDGLCVLPIVQRLSTRLDGWELEDYCSHVWQSVLTVDGSSVPFHLVSLCDLGFLTTWWLVLRVSIPEMES